MKLDGWRKWPQGQFLSRTDKKGMSCQRWLQTGYLKKRDKNITQGNARSDTNNLRPTGLPS